MSVKIRERVYSKTNTMNWQADIHVKLLDGRKVRERASVPGATSRSAALKWARERERWLILHGHEEEEPSSEEPEAGSTMPTFAEFSDRFITEYVLAIGLKPSTGVAVDGMHGPSTESALIAWGRRHCCRSRLVCTEVQTDPLGTRIW